MSIKTTRTKQRKPLTHAEMSAFTVGEHNIDEVIAGITKREKEPTLIVVDLFCGAGGTSTGFEMTHGDALVIACVNHDYMAIKSHWKNYPHIAHFEEDIRTLNLAPLVKLLDYYRILYPNAKVVLWASLECTNFSKAKGGQPRDADSRTLAQALYKVWDEHAIPESYLFDVPGVGKFFKEGCVDLPRGAYVDGDSYIQLLQPDYIQIENVVEFMSWGPLNENGKPISRKNGQDFMRWCGELGNLGYYNEWREMNSADFGAYTSRNRLFGCFAKHGLPIAWPIATHVKVRKSKGISQRSFFDSKELKPHNAVKDVLDFEDEGVSIFNRKKQLCDKTLEVIAAGLAKSIESGEEAFLFKYYGNGDNLNSINEPAGTLTTKDRFALILRQYKTGFTTSVNEPLGTIPTTPKASLVSFIMNKSHGGHTTSSNAPCPVIVASQHKAPLYVIQALMDENGIADIKMRMLKVPELKLIQGLPADYILEGSQQDQKKFIGNSVVPHVVKCWASAMVSNVNNLIPA